MSILRLHSRLVRVALGHNSKAVHRAYAKRALMKLPSLEDFEQPVHEVVQVQSMGRLPAISPEGRVCLRS